MTKNLLLKRINTKLSIVAPLWGKDILKNAAKAKKLGADMLELRIDGIKPNTPEALQKLIKSIKSRTKLPIIATIRSGKESQSSKQKNLKDNKRLELFGAIIKLIDIVDIEASSTTINKEVIKLAHRHNKLVIVSYHNFKTTPNNSTLKNTALKAHKMKADIIKITVMANTHEDAGKLMLFCDSWRKTPIVAISMGQLGSITRVVGFVYGSCLTYGYINKKNAPGQISVKELNPCSGIGLRA